MTISGTFRCLRPLNRGVRLIKISFKVNKGNKFGDFGYSVRLIEGVRLIQVSLYYSKEPKSMTTFNLFTFSCTTSFPGFSPTRPTELRRVGRREPWD